MTTAWKIRQAGAIVTAPEGVRISNKRKELNIMKIKNVCIFYSINLSQYRRLKRIERRAAKLTGRKQPAGYLLSEYLQPGANILIEQALNDMEKSLDEAELAAYDPFNDPKWPEG